MIYKFKSAATGDVIMLGPHGDQLLRLLGREPALKGIIEPGQMALAIQTLQAAIASAEGCFGRRGRRPEGPGAPAPAPVADDRHAAPCRAGWRARGLGCLNS
jgi:hypothetical protein